jgi:reverse gyrase
MIGFQQFYYSKKNKRTNEQTDKQTNERANEQTDKEQTNKRKNEQTDKRTNERTKERPTLTLTLMSSTFLSLQKKVKTFSNLFSFQVVSDSPLFFFSIYPFDESISVSFIVTP